MAINGTVSKTGVVRKTAVPSEVAASLGYAISQRLRKRIEKGFGWGKTVGGLAQVKVRGLDKVRAAFVFAMAADDIVRLPKLIAATAKCVRRDKTGRPMPRTQALFRTTAGSRPKKSAPAACGNAVTFSTAC